MEKEKINPFTLIPDYDAHDFYSKPECKLSNYKELAKVTMIEDGLYVVESNDGNWVKLHFLEVNSWDEHETFVSSLFKCEGPGGVDHPLRECRHTYFPDNGYVFYLNYDNMVAALNYCKNYFDMD